MFWFWFAILLLISFSIIGCGIYMLYSAITGKGIPHPGENALNQFKIQYHLRGVIGAGFLAGGFMILAAIVKEIL